LTLYTVTGRGGWDVTTGPASSTDTLRDSLTGLIRDLEVLAVGCDEQVQALKSSGDAEHDEFKRGAGGRAVTLREVASLMRALLTR